METNQIATKQDIQNETNLIKEYVQALVEEFRTKQAAVAAPKYLRTRDVKKMLNISSDNTIKEMRLNGELPFTKLGDTFLYPLDDLLLILNKNKRNANPKV